MRVFAWITGQQSNIGDSLLRRPYLQALAKCGPVEVWIRNSHRAFLSGVRIPEGARLHRSFLRWYLSILSTRGPVLLALNAGQAPTGRFSFLAAQALRVACRLVRVRGGQSVWMGAAVPDGLTRRNARAYRALAAAVDTVSWREPESRAFRADALVQPDWGFAEGSDVSAWAVERDVLAVVMRGDRPRSPEWLVWVRELADRFNLSPVVAVQVEADAERAQELAQQLQGEVLSWPAGRSHAEQERMVRALYARSSLTVGDRLHGLVVAATEGSVPLGWVPTSSGKIRRHFAPTGLAWVSLHEGTAFSTVEVPTAEQIAGFRADLRKAVVQARVLLRDCERLLPS